MKKLTIKLNLDERKYDALHTFSTQKGIDIDTEFVAYFEKMYKKIVPKAVREYIEGTTLSTVSDPAGSLVTLHKRGRLIVSSYEALRHHRLDLFTVILRQIGAYIARRQMKDAVDVLLNGDGTNTGITVTALTAAPTYNDLVTLWGKLSDYNFNTILAGTTALQALLKITEFKDAQASLNIKGAGKLITPLGATLIHVPSMDAKKIIALDKNCVLEMVQAGDVLTDYDKLIDRQMERAAVSAVAGFAQIYGGAAQGLSY